MRSASVVFAVWVAVLVGCTPAGLDARAAGTLGRSHKHVFLADDGEIDGFHVYTYCRDERHHDVGSLIPGGARNFDAACVTYICRPGAPGASCDESRW